MGVETITQEYLRRYPYSKRTKSWAGRMVHIQTENGVWRQNGQGYTHAGSPDAWVLPFEEAQRQVAHCGPEKRAMFIAAATSPAGDLVERIEYHVNNPSAWSEGFDQNISDLLALAAQALRYQSTGVTGDIDDLAAVLWRADATDAGVPQSAVDRRTREAFDDQGDDTKARWRKFARAALSAQERG